MYKQIIKKSFFQRNWYAPRIISSSYRYYISFYYTTMTNTYEIRPTYISCETFANFRRANMGKSTYWKSRALNEVHSNSKFLCEQWIRLWVYFENTSVYTFLLLKHIEEWQNILEAFLFENILCAEYTFCKYFLQLSYSYLYLYFKIVLISDIFCN